MPLTFETLNHGTIAFGFCNIETDLLLLAHYFFFADDFCRYIDGIAQKPARQSYRTSWRVQYIESAENIGDLHAAIQGIHYSGFIGELYRQFPFPLKAEDFKQNPDGFQNRFLVEEIIKTFAHPIEIDVIPSANNRTIDIGSYRFSRDTFQELINYVWRGGYPRWRNEIRFDHHLWII